MRITNGDLEITKNVLKELEKIYRKKLHDELEKDLYDIDCPSYYDYQGIIDTLVVVSNYKLKQLDKC